VSGVDTLIALCRRHGVVLTANGGRLDVKAPRGVLTPALIAKLKANKPALLQALGRRRPESIHGVRLAELRTLAGEDWPWLNEEPARLEAFAHAVMTRRMRERGEVPPEYTASTLCAGCGPVPIWASCPPAVLSCPWCFNRLRGLPLPSHGPVSRTT
jgi:hypothetical protein